MDANAIITTTDQESLPATVRDYIRASISDRTRREYQRDLARFLHWADSGLPATPAQIATYLIAHGESHKAATLERWLVAIRLGHTSQNLPDPTKDPVVRHTLKGIKRNHGAAQRQVSPALKEDVIEMVSGLGNSLKDSRDRALLLVGFAGAFRRSELVSLDVNDITETREGLVVTIRKSKTDQEGRGQKIGIPFARGIHCPVKAYRAWLEASGIDAGPVFRSISRHGHLGERLHAHSVARLIKQHAQRVGLDPKDYSGHSLRSGLATSAAKAGVGVHRIKAQTRHKSTRMLDRYIRDGQMFVGNAGGIL